MSHTLLAWAFLAGAAAPLPNIPEAEKILSTLKAGHPRLMASQDDLQRTRQLIKTDSTVRGLRDELKKSAEEMLEQSPVVHRLIGPRLLDQSRLCLRRVQTLGLMYRLEGDARFARRAEQEMLAAAAFPDWNPSHFLDTAEMTHALGLGYDWLYAYLTPESRKAIREAIVNKGLKPAEGFYRKRSGFTRHVRNWSQVCNGGLTVGALAVADEEPELAAYIVSEAARLIRKPSVRLMPDGGWDEGPGYWDYAMIYTAYYLSAMRTALGTDFGLATLDGLRETGLFRIHGQGPTGLMFNYADAGEGRGSSPQMHLFSRLYGRVAYAAHQRVNRRGAHPMELVWYDPRGTEDDLASLPLDALFTNVDVAFMRTGWADTALYVGFKGGDNQSGHSNLDLGTFVIDADGQRWANELGPDDYNLPGYFGNKRWTYYRMRTEGQNTLVIGGDNQDDTAKAPILAFDSRPERASVVADLSAGYARHARRVWRGVALLERKCLLIQDEIESAGGLDAEWVMHTRAEASINGAGVVLRLKDRSMHLRAVDAAGGQWSISPVRIDPPQKPARGMNRLVLRFKTAEPRTRIAIAFWPGSAGDPPGESPSLTSLEHWPGRR